MTEITGKIYQMKNAAGTENRFPRTVIEGVLGLSSYLQTQFSSLANIYMPIEGIHEAKTGQEFVYRATPNTIKANLLNLDKIYGKSLGWNQLVTTQSGANSAADVRGNDGSPIIVYDYNTVLYSEVVTSPKKVSCIVDVPANPTSFAMRRNGQSVDFYMIPADSDLTNRVKGHKVYICTYIKTVDYTVANGYTWDGTCLIDLTLLFNGNVPENYTVADFERDFPELYYPYDSGRLINNDAESVECVGRNVWDEEWELGDMEQTDGSLVPANDRIRCKNYIPVIAGSTYYCASAYVAYLIFYDSNYNHLSSTQMGYFGNYTVTAPSNAAYVRFYCVPTYGTTYNYDICINLSDASFNGQYEPYWKKDLHLGLGNFKVKSPNIWDEEWEIGYWDGNTEAKGAANNMKCKYHIPVQPNTTYFITAPYGFWVGGYDKDKQYIDSLINWANYSASFTTQVNCYYITFYVYQVGLTTYQNNICINKSDPAFNGRYFSHEDITITGGLKGNGDWADMIVGNKDVKKAGRVDLGDLVWSTAIDSQGNTIFTTDNLASLIKVPATDANVGNIICSSYSTLSRDDEWGSGSDMVIAVNRVGHIFINNYSQSASSIDGNGHADWIEGVMLDYELQYPETYELVTPIATSLRAGTTEARISPNSYGLSAPMVCDITYSVVQDASSAGDAQYSVTAGKLLNTHKIWGQDFDGTQDVSGAMSGVSSIDGAIHFDLTEPSSPLVGIAKTNPTVRLDVNGEIKGSRLHSTVANGTAPLTVVSSTLVTNLNTEKVGGCTVEQITAPLAEGIASNASRIQSLEDWLVNPSLDELTADELNVIESLRVGKGIFVWDSANNALRFKGNFYADGFITAYGINGGARTSVIAPYVIESSNCDVNKIYVGLNVLNEAIAKYKQGYLIQAKESGTNIIYSVTSIDESGSSPILYCNGGSVTVEQEA